MKKIFYLSTIMFSFLLVACGGEKKAEPKAEAPAAPKEVAASNTGDAYTVDVTNSQIIWIGSKPVGKHTGTINLKEGTLYGSDKTLNGGSFTVDMTSIAVTDLKAGEGKEDLEGHLLGKAEGKEDHFFNVAKFPTASFTMKSIKALAAGGENTHEITGDLTIRDQTQTITFPANVVMSGDIISATAPNISLDRTKFGVNYGSKSIFDDLGDKFIDDEMILNITLNAKK